MSTMTLSRYFALRFFVAVAGVFAGVFVLVAFVDYIDVMRKASDVPNAPISQLMLMSLYRVPQTMERLLPFSVLVAALIQLGVLSKQNEITAFKACGVSLYRLAARFGQTKCKKSGAPLVGRHVYDVDAGFDLLPDGGAVDRPGGSGARARPPTRRGSPRYQAG